MMGGKFSVDFLAPSGSGENTLVTCENGDFAADLEVARAVPRAAEFPRAARRAGGGRDARASTTIEALAELPRDRRRRDLEGDAGDEGRRHGRARARPRRRPARASEAGRGARRRLAARDRGRDPGGVRRRAAARSARSASRARSSPTRRSARASSSPARTATAGTCAASRPAATSRRASPTSACRSEGDRCPHCGGALQLPDGDRGRAHLQARHALLGAARARRSSTRTARRSRSSMGSYGIGPGRVMAAAVEQRHDEDGIRWPRVARAVRCARGRAAGGRGAGRAGGRERSSAAGPRRAARRPRAAGGGEVRRRRPDRASRSGSPSGKKTLEDGKVDVRDRATGRRDALTSPSWARRL